MEIHEALSEHKELLLFELEGYRVLFRPLSWRDYQNFSHLFKTYPDLAFDLEDLIWKVAVIEHNYESGTEYMEAGIVSTIAQLILYHSGCGFQNEDSLDKFRIELDIAREKTKSISGQIKLAISEAFPTYRLEEIEQLSWPDVLERLAFAEHLLKKKFDLKLKTEEPIIEDDSARVFSMLKNFSSGDGPGRLGQKEEDIDVPKGQKKWSR